MSVFRKVLHNAKKSRAFKKRMEIYDKSSITSNLKGNYFEGLHSLVALTFKWTLFFNDRSFINNNFSKISLKQKKPSQTLRKGNKTSKT
jgi:hypothetical protein